MDRSEISALLDMPLDELILKAGRVRQEARGDELELCNIMNAKSGLCGEDCKFCAQSLRHKTQASRYPLKTKDEIIKAARWAKEIGAHRFDVVTSGATLTKDELNKIIEAVSQVTKEVGIDMCASLGKLDKDSLGRLKKAGVSRYHHNIETSPRYFSKIVTSHTFQERVDTIKAAKSVGLEVCSGGIIGMGETWDDRIEMALVLKELDVDSVPINILVPIKGTPLENVERLSPQDAIRTIAIFRIILKDKIVKIAAGRESVLKDFQSTAFMAGANGMLIGGYLTIKGRSLDDDKILIEEIKKAWKS
ncbi:MAG: biotin synthase BioB [Candidatus Omnitrophota bacterium]|nr:biotin synthase BioB [Candidatus Omnitrophota bacterium]